MLLRLSKPVATPVSDPPNALLVDDRTRTCQYIFGKKPATIKCNTSLTHSNVLLWRSDMRLKKEEEI